MTSDCAFAPPLFLPSLLDPPGTLYWKSLNSKSSFG